jgi:quinol monooxygenase YgiN
MFPFQDFGGFSTMANVNDTAIYISTFRAKEGSEAILLHELERLVSSTRRESSCLFCDLFRLSADEATFVVNSVWSSREVWLSRAGWEGHPAGLGLIDQCLLRPIEVVELEEIA